MEHNEISLFEDVETNGKNVVKTIPNHFTPVCTTSNLGRHKLGGGTREKKGGGSNKKGGGF